MMKIFFSEESINEICTKNFTDKQANDELFKLLEENEMKNTKIIEVKKQIQPPQFTEHSKITALINFLNIYV